MGIQYRYCNSGSRLSGSEYHEPHQINGNGGLPPPLESLTICDGSLMDMPRVPRACLASVRRDGRLVILHTAETNPAHYSHMRSHRSNGRLQMRIYSTLTSRSTAPSKEKADLKPQIGNARNIVQRQERPALAKCTSTSLSEKRNPSAEIAIQENPHLPSTRNPKIVKRISSPSLAAAQHAGAATRQEHHCPLAARNSSPYIISWKAETLSCAPDPTLRLLHDQLHRHAGTVQYSASVVQLGYPGHNHNPQIESKASPHVQFVVRKEEEHAADKVPAKEEAVVAERASKPNMVSRALEKVERRDTPPKVAKARTWWTEQGLADDHDSVSTTQAEEEAHKRSDKHFLLPHSLLSTLRPLRLLNL
ncbi:hypothetical protein GOP47_0020173 [Adiantum capillus-veneris]|uniref:FAF domain-containing protein n=1 Tax=Adiantum capillus-veneris TaxID=13818 RepID=A0A9D4UDF4_ADICA|nr:hypothetical protein GOP47_0020173 [Adiantum capillus-veneris]